MTAFLTIFFFKCNYTWTDINTKSWMLNKLFNTYFAFLIHHNDTLHNAIYFSFAMTTSLAIYTTSRRLEAALFTTLNALAKNRLCLFGEQRCLLCLLRITLPTAVITTMQIWETLVRDIRSID